MADIIYVELDYVVPGYTVSTLDGAVAIVTAFSMDGPANSGWAVDGYWDPGYVSSGPEGTRVTVKEGAANLSSVDTFTISAEAQKNFAADLVTTVTMLATASRTLGIGKEYVSWDKQTADWNDWIGYTWDGDNTGLILPAVSTLQIDAKSNADATLDAHVVATVTADTAIILGGSCNQASAFTFTVQADKLREGAATLASTATVSVAGGQRADALANIVSAATLVSDRAAIRGGAGAITTTATVSGTPERVRTGAAALASTGSQLAATAIVRGTGATITAVATISAQGNSTCAGEGAFLAQASVTCSALQISANRGVFTAISSLNATGYRTQPGAAQAVSNFSVTAIGGKLASASATLQAFDTVLTVGRKLPIKIEYQISVAQESRILSALVEQRVLNVAQETRLNIVLPESRDLTVPEETRVYSVI